MLAFSNDPSIIHDYYYVRCDNGAESVSDDKTGSILHDFLDGVVNFSFAVGIDLACSLVKNQNRRILQDRPGDNDSLELSAAQAGPVLTYDCIITIR